MPEADSDFEHREDGEGVHPSRVERFLIFISYRRGESAGYAGRLHESLERRLGEGQVFRDVDGLEPGQDFVEAIAARLRDCTACIVMIGDEWLHVTDHANRRRLDQSHDYVRLEIEAALARSDLLVVPVLVEGVTMPSAEDLPRTIRALSRRHALSLRDETWDSDVDRLVITLEKAVVPRPISRRVVAWSAIALVCAIAAVFAMFMPRSPETAAPETAAVEQIQAGTSTPARAIVLPRLAEAAHGQLIYAVLAGDIASNGSQRTLRLRIRLSNEGSSPANFWDDSFRLAVQGQVFAPTGGLNEVVSGHSIQQGVITFKVPAGSALAALRVVVQGVAAEIPLELSGVDDPSRVDIADTGDALSRAQVIRVARDAVSLVDGKDVSFTLAEMIARRFVNVLRIVATIRVNNGGPYPWHFGSDAIRLVVDGQPIAPVINPNALVAASSATSGDFAFDVPPAATRVVLRVTSVPGSDRPFDLPPSPR
jgi:TIR domain